MRRAKCVDCGREDVPVKIDGTLRTHRRWRGAGFKTEYCPGTGKAAG